MPHRPALLWVQSMNLNKLHNTPKKVHVFSNPTKVIDFSKTIYATKYYLGMEILGTKEQKPPLPVCGVAPDSWYAWCASNHPK